MEISLSFLGFIDDAISLLLSLLTSLSSTLYVSYRNFFGKFDMIAIVWFVIMMLHFATTFGYCYDMVYFCNASYFFSLHTIKSMLQSCLVTQSLKGNKKEKY